jgi:hypothetical protein
MRINYMGREVNGRFSSFKIKFVRFTKRLMFWSFIAGLVYGSFQVGVSTNEVSYAKEIVQVDNLGKKVEELKWEVVDVIQACESAGHTEDDAIIMYDNNQAGTLKGKNVWSLGQLQWKVPTIQHYVKLLEGKVITQKEAVTIALDTDRARELAYKVIFQENGLNNWKNCADKTKSWDKLKVISQLEK